MGRPKTLADLAPPSPETVRQLLAVLAPAIEARDAVEQPAA